jgi:hypothetical protein
MARGNPIAKAAGYAAPYDSGGVDDDMKKTLSPGPKMDKTESDYVAQAKNKTTAKVAVQRARKANKQQPAPDAED